VTLLPLVSNVAPPAPKAASRVEMSVVVPDAHCSPPPLSVIKPEPKLFAELKLIRPPVTLVPPEYVFVPESVSVPAPILLSNHWLLLEPPLPASSAITSETVCD